MSYVALLLHTFYFWFYESSILIACTFPSGCHFIVSVVKKSDFSALMFLLHDFCALSTNAPSFQKYIKHRADLM